MFALQSYTFFLIYANGCYVVAGQLHKNNDIQ